jgi:hypothetical protein
MKKKETEYQVMIGYKAVITIDVKSDSEEEAKRRSIEIFKTQKDKMYRGRDINLEDDSFNAYGIVNMDETWNLL